jgi:hypothetical protein
MCMCGCRHFGCLRHECCDVWFMYFICMWIHVYDIYVYIIYIRIHNIYTYIHINRYSSHIIKAWGNDKEVIHPYIYVYMGTRTYQVHIKKFFKKIPGHKIVAVLYCRHKWFHHSRQLQRWCYRGRRKGVYLEARKEALACPPERNKVCGRQLRYVYISQLKRVFDAEVRRVWERSKICVCWENIRGVGWHEDSDEKGISLNEKPVLNIFVIYMQVWHIKPHTWALQICRSQEMLV